MQLLGTGIKSLWLTQVYDTGEDREGGYVLIMGVIPVKFSGIS